MASARWAPRLGLASAVIVAAGCIAVLATHAAEDRRLHATQPGAAAPDFVLPIISAGDRSSGQTFRLADQKGSVVVLYFCSTRCPVSNDYEQRVIELQSRLAGDARVRFVAVHTGYPPAAPGDVAGRSLAAGQQFASVIDVDGAIATRYSVRCTPTFFVIDTFGGIRYRGAFDDNRNAQQAAAAYLEDAVRQVLAGRMVKRPLTEAVGCAVALPLQR